MDGVLDSSLEWGRLAQRLQADIAEQPEMLQGELREYQMQVRAAARPAGHVWLAKLMGIAALRTHAYLGFLSSRSLQCCQHNVLLHL